MTFWNKTNYFFFLFFFQLNTSGQFQSLSGLQFTSISGQPATITNQGLTVQSVPTMGGMGISTFSESTLTQTFSTAQTTTMSSLSSPMTSTPVAESPASSRKKAWKKKKVKEEQVMVTFINFSVNIFFLHSLRNSFITKFCFRSLRKSSKVWISASL